MSEELNNLLRGAVDVINRAELEKRLNKGKPLRVKLGIDPSSPDIHLGHTVVLRRLRAFQDAGHQAVLIIGDYTAMVGDPSGKNKTRPQLKKEDVERNADTYIAQAAKILDMDKVELRRNGEWFSEMEFLDVLKLCARSTVARMMERDDFTKRFKSETPISIHEFLYPLMQGWDSVMIKADIELGGTDQLFNLLMGRRLQEQENQRPQICLTTPIIAGLDGEQKMSKSLGNAIGVLTEPVDMFGKVMSIPDALMQSWFTLLTTVPEDDVKALCDDSQTHPRDAKLKLAGMITTAMHDEVAAEAGKQAFVNQFSKGGMPDDVPTVALEIGDEGMPAWAIVKNARGLSGGDSRRIVKQNGAKLLDANGENEQPLADKNYSADELDGCLLKVGKRHWFKLTT
ncbi:tyrosine--tRNA ligase [Planctomycetota bacterium]|nr:tyrosine--tRNA ligase [Planctomycetota bacterium]